MCFRTSSITKYVMRTRENAIMTAINTLSKRWLQLQEIDLFISGGKIRKYGSNYETQLENATRYLEILLFIQF